MRRPTVLALAAALALGGLACSRDAAPAASTTTPRAVGGGPTALTPGAERAADVGGSAWAPDGRGNVDGYTMPNGSTPNAGTDTTGTGATWRPGAGSTTAPSRAATVPVGTPSTPSTDPAAPTHPISAGGQ